MDNATHNKVGTTVRLKKLKVKGENFEHWINRKINPSILLELLDFECAGTPYSVISIEPSFERPVQFDGTAFVRIGENKKKLDDFPEHQRALWLATGRRKFEHAIAITHATQNEVFSLLNTIKYYELTGEPVPQNQSEILRRFIARKFINDDREGGYDITNLGAILFANDIRSFPSIATKSVRVIRYSGVDKRISEKEQEGQLGYAVGFSGLVKYVLDRIPHTETYVGGVRRTVPIFPSIAVREVVANALIHQDFTHTGAGPVIEIYANRVEVTNPGSSLIQTDRMLDERRSRNEALASAMRELGLCEERGGGLDKVMIEVEMLKLPAPDLISSNESMRVVLYGPKAFTDMSKQDKQRACFFHCVLCWLKGEFMGNASLRERFSLPDEDYQAVWAVISEAVKANRISPADPKQGKRNAKYVPYWVTQN